MPPSIFNQVLCFTKFFANSSAFLKSSLFGLPLFIPPKYFRKLLVLKPLQLNSPFAMYPFDWSFCLNAKWSFATLFSPIIALVEKASYPLPAAAQPDPATLCSALHCRCPKRQKTGLCYWIIEWRLHHQRSALGKCSDSRWACPHRFYGGPAKKLCWYQRYHDVYKICYLNMTWYSSCLYRCTLRQTLLINYHFSICRDGFSWCILRVGTPKNNIH